MCYSGFSTERGKYAQYCKQYSVRTVYPIINIVADAHKLIDMIDMTDVRICVY